MNKGKVNIIGAAVAVLALAGCTATPQVHYPQGKPIMSAADASAMIQVEVRTIEPAPAEQTLTAANN